MVFSSIIFLAAFLPITFILYYIPIPFKEKAGITYRNIILVIASLIFYAFGEPIYVFLMIGSVLLNYLFGMMLGAGSKSSLSKHRKLIVVLSVIVNVLILGVFKYAGFFVSSIDRFFGLSIPVPKIALPIGISFFTFQAMSYVIDVYRDSSMRQKSFGKVLLYISFFPQLIAGPIVRYHDIDEQLTARGKAGRADMEKITAGLLRFSKGLAKKVIIANNMGFVADKVYALDITKYGAGVAWMGAVCYVFQIYFDFSGYSDMAIGLAKVFGFDFLENFDHPYSSLSIKEFWRRWHISLSTWFKEYVYIPLGGNRKGRARTEINKFIVFFLTGFWHGANWTFIIWGLFHGLFLTLEDTILPIAKIGAKKTSDKSSDKTASAVAWWGRFVRNIYVWLVVIVGFVFFRADTLTYALQMLKQMFTGFGPAVGSRVALGVILEQANLYAILVFAFAIIFSYPISKKVSEKMSGKKMWEPVLMFGSMMLLVLCILSLASSAYNPFIYFRF